MVAAVFYAVLKTGADNINMFTNVPKEIVSLIQALIILFLAVKLFRENKDHISVLKTQILSRFQKNKQRSAG